MSHTKEEIFNHISQVLQDQFEIEADKISLEAQLHDDLDIDSIDAVDLMIELKSLTGKKMALEDFQEVRTIDDVVNAIHRVVQEESAAKQDSQ
ncbi:acyl carrier protein [Agarilytica rhodophyticola]|uniref:acyl carrier protein n=1 Tax=Agarilytica rhodophyticola TaxID=1737490 RepID=UPI000B344F74|nr:acyl carrier protein [Agarilytica rhodophyticola]